MYFIDAAIIKMVGPVTSQSWIGQTVKLTCAADGSPTPTLSWKNPSGRVIRQTTAWKTTVYVFMRIDMDFGNYTCEATNDLNTDTSTVLVQQISKWNIFSLVVYLAGFLKPVSPNGPFCVQELFLKRLLQKLIVQALLFSLLLLFFPFLFLFLLSPPSLL